MKFYLLFSKAKPRASQFALILNVRIRKFPTFQLIHIPLKLWKSFILRSPCKSEIMPGRKKERKPRCARRGKYNNSWKESLEAGKNGNCIKHGNTRIPNPCSQQNEIVPGQRATTGSFFFTFFNSRPAPEVARRAKMALKVTFPICHVKYFM